MQLAERFNREPFRGKKDEHKSSVTCSCKSHSEKCKLNHDFEWIEMFCPRHQLEYLSLATYQISLETAEQNYST